MDTKTKPFADEWLDIPLHSGHVLELLRALNGPPHLMRELQVLSGSAVLKMTGTTNPIDELTDAFNAWVQHHQGKAYAWIVLPTIEGISAVFHYGLPVLCSGRGTRPSIFGRRKAAVEWATNEQKEWGGKRAIVRVRIDDLSFEAEGDIVGFEPEIVALESHRFDPTDIQIIQGI